MSVREAKRRAKAVLEALASHPELIEQWLADGEKRAKGRR